MAQALPFIAAGASLLGGVAAVRQTQAVAAQSRYQQQVEERSADIAERDADIPARVRRCGLPRRRLIELTIKLLKYKRRALSPSRRSLKRAWAQDSAPPLLGCSRGLIRRQCFRSSVAAY